MKKIIVLCLVLVLPCLVFAAGNEFTKNRKDYTVKHCVEYDITSDGSGNASTSTTAMEALGHLWVSIMPDLTGSADPYDGNNQPTDNFTFNVVNEWGAVVATMTLDNATETNTLVLDPAGMAPVYFQELAVGKPNPRTIYFTFSGMGSAKKLRLCVCYEIN